jgi:ABC-2 type transport system ATP-binding protein
MQSKIIEIKNLTKKYDDFTAVNNLSMDVGKGEIFGLLGPNGAGKSTTILMLMGLTEPSGGEIRVCGLDPVSNPIEVKKKVGYLPEDVGFYDDLTGFENLVYTARLNGISDKESVQKAQKLFKRVGLTEQMGKKAGKYSKGMRQRLGLADVLIKSPEIIILDEPTLGIDPAGIKDFLELIVSLSREEGITVLFSSHLLHQVQQVCDRVGIFVHGNLLAEGDISSLAGQLFPGSAFRIEAKIAAEDQPSMGPESKDHSHEQLTQTLHETEGVEDLTWHDNTVTISCNRDVTAEIARKIISSGRGLLSLNKKEYGLDDIYYRYFEGGTHHG